MASYAIDLHNHMPVPDGDYRGPLETSGEQVVATALAAGLDALGVSDHFSLGFFRAAQAAAEGTRLLVLPGVEARLSWDGDEAHLVAFFPTHEAQAGFDAFMGAIGYDERARTCPLQRVVVEHDPVRAARAVADLGGMCLVGHVDRFFGDYRLLGSPLLQRLVEQDTGVALEFVDRSKAELLGTAARKVAIVQSSDSHRLEEIGRRRTVIEAEELSFEGIRAALLPRVLEAAS